MVPGIRLGARLQTQTLHLVDVEDRWILTPPNDVEFYPLHSPSTRRDHRPSPTTVKIFRTWPQQSSDNINMVPRQGSQRQEPCPCEELLLNETVTQDHMVDSPIKQLPKESPTTPTTWSKVNFIDKTTFKSPPRPPKFIDPSDTLFGIQVFKMVARSEPLDLGHGSDYRRPTIPIKKQSLNSVPWQTPFGTRPLPTKQHHG
jgi:hypothetical protein